MECCQNTANGSNPAEATRQPQQRTTGGEDARFWVRAALAALLSGNAMVVGLAINLSSLEANVRLFVEIALLGSTIIVFELVGRRLARRTWDAMVTRNVTFELLFVAGIVGSIGASIASMILGEGPVYFEIASLLMVIYAAGDKVGRVSRERGLAAARDWGVDDQEARLLTDCGHTRLVPLEQIEVDDRVVVEPGETIPIDGRIDRGEGFVRDAHVTGEWASSVKRPGDPVFAGSDVVDQRLVIETEAAVGQRMLDAIQTSVEQAWQRPSRWQVEANRIVQWFFPLVVVLTVATFGVWWWADGWHAGLFNGLAVLLIACPCALGFAVPLAVWMSLGKFAEDGLVADGGDLVERLHRCDVALFDKTGTLTTGGARLVDLVADPDFGTRSEIFELARTVEEGSDHPIARAFREAELEAPDESPWKLLETRLVPGAGIEGVVRHLRNGQIHRVAIGIDAIVPLEERARAEAMADRLHMRDGHRRIAVVVDGRVVGAAAIAEQPAEKIDQMLRSLEQADITPVLVTGDAPSRAERLGFERVYAKMNPTQKEALVRRLRADGHRVLYIGDGVNDAAAMAAADVGIARSTGSQITVDTADATWHGSDPTQISRAIETARRAVSMIRSNLRYAVIYNLAGIGAAAAGLLHPVLAAILMVSSSLFVTWRTALGFDS